MKLKIPIDLLLPGRVQFQECSWQAFRFNSNHTLSPIPFDTDQGTSVLRLYLAAAGRGSEITDQTPVTCNFESDQFL